MSVSTPSATGVPGLDDILGGGLPSQRSYLLQGVPGSGKTTLAMQVLLAGLQRGERCLYITMSETRDELEGVAASHGWSLAGLAIIELSMLEDLLDPNGQSTLFNPAEVDLGNTMDRVHAEIESTKPTLIVFDSLTELRLLCQDDLRFRRQLLALKQRLTRFQSTLLLLDDLSLPGEERLVQSLVHGVMSLERTSTNYGTIRRRIIIEKLRGVAFDTGHHDYIIERGGVRVFPRLVAADHHAEHPDEALKSGLPELDAMLGGGLKRGSSTLIIGPAGAGKSSVITAFLHGACRAHEKTVIWTFEETLDIFLERARGLGMDLLPLIASEILTVRQVDPAQISPGELAQAVKRDVDAGARLVAIDSLSGYLNAMPEERHLHLHLHEMLTYLNQQGVVSILTLAQHGLVTPVHSTDISYIADSVLLLRFFEAFGRVKKAISVVKKRTGGHEDTIREFSMAGGMLRIGEPLIDFQGVLLGVPSFFGKRDAIMENPHDGA